MSRLISIAAASRSAKLRHIRKHTPLHRWNSSTTQYDYDLVVIGGGSGGLACAKEAANFDKRILVLDYVAPSSQGTKWGLGGTCVNVGCIPKKLMHHASLLGQAVQDARKYGWDLPERPSHSWPVLVEGIQNYVKSLNWGYRVQLYDKRVEYTNAMASFVDWKEDRDRHVIALQKSDSSDKKLVTTERVVIAVGGRPRYPQDVTGAQDLGITSDDIFSLSRPPGKTLVIGGSYVALECAGFLHGLGFPTSIMVRSKCLKDFDQQMAKMVTDHMEKNLNVNFLWKCHPLKLEQGSNQKLLVTYRDSENNSEVTDEYDTVLFATGRYPVTSKLNATNTDIKISSNGKVDCKNEQSSAPHVYAVGDVVGNGIELTPVAIKAGKLLARRMFGPSQEYMDYEKVPTTVFTPLEYSKVGISEDEAAKRFGEENIEVYHAYYKPVEFIVSGNNADQCYIKMVCKLEGEQEVLGLHLVGPNAGEVMQGFAVAFRKGLTRHDVESTVAIHPTCAEEILKMYVTKRSGLDPTLTGC